MSMLTFLNHATNVTSRFVVLTCCYFLRQAIKFVICRYCSSSSLIFGYKKTAETFYASTTLTVSVSDKFFLPYDGQSFYLIAFYYISEIVLRNTTKPHRAPLVMVARKPQFAYIRKGFIFLYRLVVKVTMIIDYRHIVARGFVAPTLHSFKSFFHFSMNFIIGSTFSSE